MVESLVPEDANLPRKFRESQVRHTSSEQERAHQENEEQWQKEHELHFSGSNLSATEPYGVDVLGVA